MRWRDKGGQVVQRTVNAVVWPWVIAIAFFGVGDLVTTGYGTALPAITEGNPIVAALLGEQGIGGLFLLKVAAFGVALVAWRTLDDPHKLGVPISLALIGAWVTTWNLVVLGLVPGI